MTENYLRNQVATPVGGTSDTSLEIARYMANAGCSSLALVGRNKKNGAAAETKLRQLRPKVDVRLAAADASDDLAAAALAAHVAVEFGCVHTLIYGVGGTFWPEPFERIDLTTIDSLILTDLASALHIAHAFLPFMIEHRKASSLLVGWDASKVATRGEAVMGAAEAGLAMFARTLSLEVGRHDIRVNCIAPIVQWTQTHDRLMADEFNAGLFQKAERCVRVGVATPSDIGPSTVFLEGSLGSEITGQTVSVRSAISAAWSINSIARRRAGADPLRADVRMRGVKCRSSFRKADTKCQSRLRESQTRRHRRCGAAHSKRPAT